MLATWQPMQKQMAVNSVLLPRVGQNGCSVVIRLRQLSSRELELGLRMVMDGRRSIRRWRGSVSHLWRLNK